MNLEFLSACNPSMRLILTLVYVIAVVDGSLIQDLVEKQLESMELGIPCETDTIADKEEFIECDLSFGRQVPDGVKCKLYSSAVVTCVDGHWVFDTALTGNKDEIHQVRKRGLIAGVIATNSSCLYFCGSGDNSNPAIRKVPTYSDCPPVDILPVYYTDKGETSTNISWTSPLATDTEGNVVRSRQLSTPLNGGRFEGTTYGQIYSVMYEAVGKDGLKAFCVFNFTVKVRSCPTLPWPKNGQLECDKRFFYGSNCTLTCNKGYELTGTSSTTCLKDGKWTEMPSCTKLKCPKPTDLVNGYMDCDLPTYLYQSVCLVRCNNGFALQGPMFIQCQANETWKDLGDQSCNDIVPPVLHCRSPQTFYANDGILGVSVVWEEPTAFDATDPKPIINRTDGPSLDDVLSTGRHFVIYQASDATGNLSPACTIEIRVQEITCEHPFEILQAKNMILSCSGSRLNYGASCNLSCDYNLPLEGSSTITCGKNVINGIPIGVWDWGGTVLPYCRDKNCPNLDSPTNGYFIHETVNGHPVKIVHCNENYTRPFLGKSFNGQLSCHLEKGSWSPMNRTPDCVEPHQADHMKLPSELLYYYTASGNCSEEEIRQSFLTAISDIINPSFSAICPSEITCTVGTVKVQCGQKSKRRKRELSHSILTRIRREETETAVVTFDIETGWSQGTKTIDYTFNVTDNLQAKQKQVFASFVNNGTFDLEEYTLKSDSFQTNDLGILACNTGLILEGIICKPCPRGMFLDEVENSCKECPIGQYMDTDGNTSCKLCPVGYSTLLAGSKQREACIKQCTAGSISPTTLKPCTPCPLGTYQNSDGMTVCTKCPSGQTTAFTGSSNKTMCQNFDVLLLGALSDSALGSLAATQSMTVILWVKQFKIKTPRLILKIKDGLDTILTIDISSTLSVHIGQDVFDSVAITQLSDWMHVAVTIDEDSLQIYCSGLKMIDEKISRLVKLSGSFILSASAPDGLFISALQIIERNLTENDITSLLTSCAELAENSTISMDSFLQTKHENINIITPAVCDAVNDCASSPCGDHQCVNEIDGFRCICSHGMTGLRCEIPANYCTHNKCKNGATCQSDLLTYSCSCLLGYSGPFCEDVPVNGGWSDNGEWSACSASCNGGVRSRNRSCDSPAPGVGGMDCSGPAEETQPCNAEICKECSEPERPIEVILNCTTDKDSQMKHCNPFCSHGMIMQPDRQRIQKYTCGPETNFEWTPYDSFPSCVDPTPPIMYRLKVTGHYRSVIPSSITDDVTAKLLDNLSATHCMKGSKCQASVSLTSESGVLSEVTLILSVAITSKTDFNINGYLSSGSVSTTLQEVAEAIVTLELTAADVKSNWSNFFNVIIGAQSYTFSGSTLNINGAIDCPGGTVPTQGICVPVKTNTQASSAATFLTTSTADGTYTAFPDSKAPSEALGRETSTTMSSGIAGADGIPSGTIAAIAIGCVAVILSLSTVVFVVYRSTLRKHRRPENHRFTSFDNVYIMQPSHRSSVDRGIEYKPDRASNGELTPPPAYTRDSSPANTYLHAVASFTSGDLPNHRDSENPYLIPMTSVSSKETACERYSSPYLHAVGSFVETDKDDIDQGYATIPLTHVGSSQPPPYSDK